MLKEYFNNLLSKNPYCLNKGNIISFEGFNNGKNLSMQNIEKYLNNYNISFIKFHFPDISTYSGKLIKQYLQNQQYFTPLKIHNLFVKNIQEKQNQIINSLYKFDIVLIDRYIHGIIIDSVERGVDLTYCINSVDGFIKPDFIIYYGNKNKMEDETWEYYFQQTLNIFKQKMPYKFNYIIENQITISLISQFINCIKIMKNCKIYSADIFYIIQYNNKLDMNTFYNFDNLIYQYKNKKRANLQNIFNEHWISYLPMRLEEVNHYNKNQIDKLIKEYQKIIGFQTLEEYAITKEQDIYIKFILKSCFYVPNTVEELKQLNSLIDNKLFTRLINSRFGDYHEPKAIKLYGKIFNISVFYNNTNKSFKRYTGEFNISGKIDGLALIDNKVVLLEIKTKINKFSYKIYRAHYLQIQACLWITNIDEARLIQYHPSSKLSNYKKFKVNIIKRDEMFINIFPELKKFLININKIKY